MFVVGQDEVVDALGQFVAGGELGTAEQPPGQSRENSSTWLSQEVCLGVWWTWKRGCVASQAFVFFAT